MRGTLIIVVALCGCDQVLGIHGTAETPVGDARYFDAPLDAPFACPAIGTTPGFSRLLHQIPQDCREYTFGGGRALALCLSGLFQGPLDGTLASVDEINGLGGTVRVPRLFPEGDQLAVVFQQFMAGYVTIDLYRADSNHVWTASGSLGIPGDVTLPYAQLGVPSRGPIRRIMVVNADNTLHELEVDETQGTSREVTPYTGVDLGIQNIDYAGNLSPDGLRMTMAAFVGFTLVEHYSDRATLADKFRPLEPIPGIPPVGDAVMNEDCSRMYYSGGVSSVLWVQRL